MPDIITVTANWETGNLSSRTISRQYDNNRYRIQFMGYPEDSENLIFYLLIFMQTAEAPRGTMLAPIRMDSDQWTISNYFTQIAQQIRFQLCIQNEAGTYEAHSPVFNGSVLDSLEHDGEDIDIDTSALFDYYREYINQLIIEAGAVVIDTALDATSENPVQNKAVAAEFNQVNGRLDELEQGGAGMSSTAKTLLISILRNSMFASEQADNISALETALEVGDIVYVTGISISPTSSEIVYGNAPLTIRATVTPSNATNKGVAWASSDETVATVSANGVVTPLKSGTTTITATTIDGGYVASCYVTVTIENLIDLSAITEGAYINRDNGNALASQTFNATNYIWLKPNTTFYCEGTYMENFYAFYNTSKTFVTSPPSDVTVTYEPDRNNRRSRKGTITTGANGYYFRGSIDVNCPYTPYVALTPIV